MITVGALWAITTAPFKQDKMPLLSKIVVTTTMDTICNIGFHVNFLTCSTTRLLLPSF